ncbi:hypothetical protein A3C60_00640 [Candidatus Nomurabacteria bacterium RIFCSPHIGHO2_02_FULL_37_45]|uniref:Cell shape-determining protein MreC n=1 Tax=Candidatus Nomurabacteria bacterium RIFCSPHIGHO2_12_FULL_37_29 TaxID=1801759 RepID=A0A1F6WC70_9BACT|nr:MAG: hypothetical protein A2727_00610 [Candidatus Nomurabacteria bacterium RIFCSPHIGHO2_01_FULL_37_110]OGI71456.1 MAG: hypothetical protein A3C60_00640 [Candidatus Nomurabacteria bacterium RIFCSPHIGHO2_02_FULL_37_45]OGI79491.1 MAG: hypothetical protein A3F19_02110 [Candidatus Nomurabacteria bacterium RIFCSPHIGHO2_12_FULL_37_29]OGI85458.1 MAG: hypothetical protein A3A92_00270 [Candidatus Nomurabacteria bacterium RIFCSPLOWO2_01_FULL_37_49]
MIISNGIKRKKFLSTLFFIIIFSILFYFKLSIFNGLAFISHKIFYPVLILGNSIGEKFRNINSLVTSKNSLYLENKNLKIQSSIDKTMMSNYNSVLTENISLKEILGRKSEKSSMILAAILSKPNQSLYDTLVIDVGTNKGIHVGEMVFALGNVPMGRVAETYPNSSKVILFSSKGEKTQGVVSEKNIFMEVVGRGGGNFEMILPRDLALLKRDQVVLPGIIPHVLGVVATIISDPRDPFQKALLVSPVNIQELKFVEVEVSAK